MRPRMLLAVLVVSAAACSENTATSTDLTPSFADGPCVNNATLTPPIIPTVPRNAARIVPFTIHNNCSNTSSTWELIATPSGTVLTAAPSTSSVTLAPSATATINVRFTTGNTAGKGRVTLTAGADNPGVTISTFAPVTVSP